MTIDQFNFAGKKAFVRVDFNVPLDENFNITDDTRMRAALPTLKKILADGGSIIIGSHLGRPKGVTEKFSLKHILKHLNELLGVEVQFANDCMGEEAAVKAAALKPGEVLLLENLRFYAEEEGKPRGLADDATDEEKAAAKKAVKESQKEFTKKLASYADCYVNDAFGTAHRAHASTALIAKYFDTDHKMFGYLMEKEVKAVDKVLNDIHRPFTAIMGGSKVSSKIEIIENLLNKVDNLIIAGGMTYTFTKAMGGKIGLSICEDDKLDLALDLMKKAKDKGVNLVLASGHRPEDGRALCQRHQEFQDDPVERPDRCIRVRELHTWFPCCGRSHRGGHEERSLLAGGRRRLCGLHQQVWLGQGGFLCFHGRWRLAGSHRRKNPSGYRSHQRITTDIT